MQLSGQLHVKTALTPVKRAPGTHWIGNWIGKYIWSGPLAEKTIFTDFGRPPPLPRHIPEVFFVAPTKPCRNSIDFGQYGWPTLSNPTSDVLVITCGTQHSDNRRAWFNASEREEACTFSKALGPTKPPTQCVPLFPLGKTSRKVTKHSSPSNARIKNALSYTYTHPYNLWRAQCNFIF